MPRQLKRGILGASTIIQSKDIDKYAFMCGSNFYETDVKISELSDFIDLHIYHNRFTQGFSDLPTALVSTIPLLMQEGL